MTQRADAFETPRRDERVDEGTRSAELGLVIAGCAPLRSGAAAASGFVRNALPRADGHDAPQAQVTTRFTGGTFVP